SEAGNSVSDIGRIDQKGSGGSGYGEGNGQPAPAGGKIPLNISYGAAGNRALGIGIAISLCQSHFRIFDSHTKNGGNPHPKACARTANMNSQSNTGNITDAHGGREGRC